ncbi:MAG: hypothetical protein IJN22_03505 [Clostridia bacterium]|nr:hypothetical protein [Clostridia bacterium]
MQNNQKPRNKKEFALQQVKIARSNLLLMIILTVVNIVLLAVGADTMLLFSATVPYYVAAFGIFSEISQLIVAGLAIAAVILVLYLICWIFSKKHYGWMIAALVLFILDSIAMIGLYIWAEDFSGILDLVIHIWVLYYLIIGVRFGYKLKNIPPEEAVEYEQSEQIAPTADAQGNSVALRAVQNDIKNRILIDGNYLGHYICYRRAGRVNELVIDGYVYDELEILVETAHVLEATVDGHTIQVGFDGVMHSYIRIDGQRVAKKLRLI